MHRQHQRETGVVLRKGLLTRSRSKGAQVSNPLEARHVVGCEVEVLIFSISLRPCSVTGAPVGLL
jgi:hypothetical protein